jgi:hypothetical protein
MATLRYPSSGDDSRSALYALLSPRENDDSEMDVRIGVPLIQNVDCSTQLFSIPYPLMSMFAHIVVVVLDSRRIFS